MTRAGSPFAKMSLVTVDSTFENFRAVETIVTAT